MKPKTYKREIAILLFIWLAYIVETKDVNVIEILVWPIFTFSALAFGMDWFGKSGGLRGQPTEPTDGRGPRRILQIRFYESRWLAWPGLSPAILSAWLGMEQRTLRAVQPRRCSLPGRVSWRRP